MGRVLAVHGLPAASPDREFTLTETVLALGINDVDIVGASGDVPRHARYVAQNVGRYLAGASLAGQTDLGS